MESSRAAAEHRRLGHRPALDGLRGVAILLVVAWHVGVPGLDGAGQAGVTLFFVLSGFLITSLLLKEHEESGRIDFARFYRRRAARLLPALLLMMGAALVVVAVVRPPDGTIAMLAPLAYVANWAQAAGADLFPVQHTWTLAIEEQFYLAWPLVLVALLRLSRRWVIYAVVAGFFASTALRFVLAPSAEGHALWGTDTRADALMAGCAIAIVSVRLHGIAARALTSAAAIAFGVVVLVGTPPVLLAGGLTVIAITSAVLVGAAAESSTGVLTWAPLCWVGSISYGLYLWHPLLFNAFPGVPHLALVGPAFLIAAASHRWLEQPILRRARGTTPAPGLAVARP